MKYNELTLGKVEAIVNKLGGMEGVEAFLRGAFELVRVKILDYLGTTTTSATTERFVAKEKFTKESKEVKFYGFSGNFTNWFLAGNGKIEEPIKAQELRYGTLTKRSVDDPIIEELGGEAKAETTLTEMYSLLERQANGEEGILLTNGYANIFYIKDVSSGKLRSVSVYWYDAGWFVCANSVENPSDWDDGCRVFSRNS